ncbi:MAG TPA: DUF5916 domain-containing protein [Steroidobacteraceae bacterium]
MAVEINGRVDPAEWHDARHVTDFRKVQPLNGEPATLATEAWILATPEGLAVAFHNTHPASVPRSRERVQRDFSEQVDRVNLVVDFDGDHRTGYNFRVSSTDGIADAIVTNENFFNTDWDGNWLHAVSEDAEGWSVEMLIPWHIAPMRVAKDRRTLRIYLDRITGATGERVAWPLASLDRPRYLSDFAPLEVPSYSQALLAVTPYVSGLHDVAGSGSDGDAGVDVFWKPNGQLQLTATVNPDFGQVESDDLVVNFDAEETFFSDKRPFFTENQGLFEFTTPSDFSQLLYTRRVGGPADDGEGLGDIIAALKLNGSFGSTKYGVFAAEEAESVGRSFEAVRVVRDFSKQNVGFMATRTERPWLDRIATVAGIDHDWKPTARWNIHSRLFGSDIDDGAEGDTQDVGATVWADYEMDHGWRQQWIAMYFGDELEINDAGYLARNNTKYLHWQVNRRFTELPAESRYASKDWRWRLSTNYSATGQRLNHQFRMSRESRLRDGSYEYAQINVNSAGIDDLILRGNGFVNLPPNLNTYFEFDRPRKGNWGFHAEAEIDTGGLEGNHRVGYWIELTPKYFISDAFNVYLGLTSSRNPDWLVWQEGTLLGSFDRRNAEVSAGFNWTMTNRQELRLKLQAIGLDADLRQAWRIDAAGNAVETSESVDDFSVRNLGVQLRYRFEIAPLSYLYVVYARGGFRNEPRTGDSVGLLGDSFSLRDDEQLFVKFSYRFEM